MGAPNLLFCGARNAFSENWNSQHWCYLVFSQVFKSARPTGEQTNVETARNDLPITHDAFRRKWDVKAVSRNVQIQPMSRQRHNVAIRLLCKSSFGAQSNLSLRSRAQKKNLSGHAWWGCTQYIEKNRSNTTSAVSRHVYVHALLVKHL